MVKQTKSMKNKECINTREEWLIGKTTTHVCEIGSHHWFKSPKQQNDRKNRMANRTTKIS